jgi:uncharacterized lipoprotein YehR (DUF1307 family)
MMQLITLEKEDLLKMIEEVVERIKTKNGISEDRWITDKEAMRLLRISSKTTLQKLRDTGAIRFSQPAKKYIVYDRESILAYLDKHSRNQF